MRIAGELGSRFWRIVTAGIFFQGGAAAVDTSTIIAALVHALTGSALAVGAAAAIARYGWLFPQVFVAHFAQKRPTRMAFYRLGAFGRVGGLAALAVLLWIAGSKPGSGAVVAFFVLWVAYAFVSGIVAVPYNDIVARTIPSAERSRMLAVRFFGGGLLALAVAAGAHRVLGALPFPSDYAAVVLMGALLLLVSALSFVSAGESVAPPSHQAADSFLVFLRRGLDVIRADRRFRLFLISQWLGGAAAMALPFYVLQLSSLEASRRDVALLLGAQAAGALLSNPLWGWLGDRRGKLRLLEVVAALGTASPALALLWIAGAARWSVVTLPWFAVVFLLLGATGNGATIAQLGYLMEISPDERRPAYSGYFNALAAPAALLPLAGAVLAEAASFAAVFAASLGAALLQFWAVRRLRSAPRGSAP